MLSIKALRLYHEAGILVPAQTEPATGYRFYSIGQLADAAVIRRLRMLEVSLDDIRTVLAARDPEVTRSVLARHSLAMTERLLQTERIVADLQKGLAEPGTHTPVRLVDVPDQRVLTFSGTVQRTDYSEFLDEAFGTLYGTMMANSMSVLGSGALYPTEIEDDEHEDVTAYLRIGPTADDGRLDHLPGTVREEVLPAARIAVLTYTGSYDDIGAAYRSLGEWVCDHAVMSGERVREAYIVSPPSHQDPSTFVTELQWPVLSDSSTVHLSQE